MPGTTKGRAKPPLLLAVPSRSGGWGFPVEPALETLDLTGRVDDALRAGVERMAGRADVESEQRLGGHGGEGVAAAADHFGLDIFGMDTWFHDCWSIAGRSRSAARLSNRRLSRYHRMTTLAISVATFSGLGRMTISKISTGMKLTVTRITSHSAHGLRSSSPIASVDST